MSTEQITCRRTADNEVSKAFGAMKCSTHNPTPERPGRWGVALMTSINATFGTTLVTELSSGAIPALIEVYPHPALLTLTEAKERRKYKFGNRAKYWPGCDSATRIAKVLDEWRTIQAALASRIEDLEKFLQVPCTGRRPSGREMKAFEDALDAVVCAWVATCYLDGTTHPYGDRMAAIWIPKAADETRGRRG
jgi:predicted RNase H-like nuclease